LTCQTDRPQTNIAASVAAGKQQRLEPDAPARELPNSSLALRAQQGKQGVQAMADIQAFRGFRYDLGRVGALSDVIAPPYDVIDPTLQQALYDRSPHNVIRLILNKEEPTDTEADNRYTRAARTLREWQAEGVLAQDSARSLYVYHQEFEV